MTRRTTATLEWASQVKSAPMPSARMGSSARRCITRVNTSCSRNGCDAPTMRPSDRIMSARPMTILPICCQKLDFAALRRADAEEQEDGNKRGSLERERLDDDGRADIGAEHHGERRRERDKAALGEGDDEKAGRGRTLQGGGDAERRSAHARIRPASPGRWPGAAARRRRPSRPCAPSGWPRSEGRRRPED